MWNDDPILGDGGALHDEANPVFRLTAYFPYQAAHPYLMPDRWQALFDVFAPLVRQHCDKIVMWDRPGAKARRGKKIVDSDWRPFAHLLSVESDVDGGIFTGFSFLDKADALEGNGRGPCSLRFFVGKAIRFEVCVPLSDWFAGHIDIDAAIAALQALPFVSVTSGFGLSLGEQFVGGDPAAVYGPLMDYARRYPTIDIMRDEYRSFFPGDPENYPAIGIAAINWITGIGEPFRSRLASRGLLSDGLPTGVDMLDGPWGTFFRLGAAPTSGEAGIDDATLPLYRWLGQMVAHAYRPSQDDPRAPVFGGMAKAESLAWERRFYGS